MAQEASTTSIVTFLTRLGDDQLVLGHRLSEWCGHAPTLEEDLALANMGLDLIGQARALYTRAGELEGEGRGEDDFAYLRREVDYQNLLLVERPNGDFARTILKQFYFAAFMTPFWQGTSNSSDEALAAIAAKAVKESTYHLRHSAEWVIRLGDGTAESANRMKCAVDDLHAYTDEMFQSDALTKELAGAGVAPEPATIKVQWQASVTEIFDAANLAIPEIAWPQLGGRQGEHTEDMGHLLAELQFMQRAYPGLQW